MKKLSLLLNSYKNSAAKISKCCISIVILLSSSVSFAQNTSNVSGYVRESETGEVIVGALITAESGSQAVTNQYGFFMLPILASDSLLTISSVGYETYYCDISSKRKGGPVLDIKLNSNVYNLPEVFVSGENINMQHAGRIDILPLALKSAAVLGGERDMMKLMQQLPGVQAASEGKSCLSIRGGTPGENLILLDGIPVYNPEHAFGFISVFNSDAIKKVSIYKSDFPAKYGGRISSVVDILTKDGDKLNYHGNVSIGLLSAKMDIEGPIVKDKLSFSISARRTYADLFLVPLEKKMDPDNDGYTVFAFYDINAKIHCQISHNSSASVQAYVGRDKCQDSQGGQAFDTKWGNAIVSAKFNTKLGDNVFVNSSLSYDEYHYNMLSLERVADNNGENIKGGLSYDSIIKDFMASSDFELKSSSIHNITFGGKVYHHIFTPDVIEINNIKSKTPKEASINAEEISLYCEDGLKFSDNLMLTAGFNMGAYFAKDASYFQLDPRLSLQYNISENLALAGGYSWMHQNNHLLSNNSLLLQTEMWVPVTSKVKPMTSEQVSMDIKYFNKQLVDATVSMYYKELNGVIDYLDGTSFSGTSSGWEDKVAAGIGRAYGVEFYARKAFKNFIITASYTLSKTEQKFEQINYGRWYPSKYDRRHYVDIDFSWVVNEHLSLFSHWVYSSGNMLTVPMMDFIPANIPDVVGYFPEITQLEGRNNFRMPPHHRLDVGLLWTINSKQRRRSEFSINVYNAYNRHNPYHIYIENELETQDDGTKTYHQHLKQVSLFPILPSVSYTYYF